MEYWKECISEAFDEVGIKATKDQIDTVASWVEGAHENYGMATGSDVASSNYVSDDTRELEELKKSQAAHEKWINETSQCVHCNDGSVKDGWGREWPCMTCGGTGRVRRKF